MINVELWEEQKKKLGLTFDALSEKSGIPKRTILGVFRKEVATPRIDTVQAIEQALGLSKPDWTDEEKALGVGRYATYLSEEETEWLELRSEVLRVKGEDYLKTLTEMIEAVIKQKK